MEKKNEKLNVELFDYSTIPKFMQKNGMFCLWKLVMKPSKTKPDNIPYCNNGKRADVTNPQHYSSFDETVEVFAGGGYEGSGIICFELLRLVGVDNSIVNGKLDAGGQDIVNPLIPTPNLVRPGMEFISLFLQMDLQKDKPCFTQMSIGDTLYIVEFIAAETATETAYDKVKRLISDNVNSTKTLA